MNVPEVVGLVEGVIVGVVVAEGLLPQIHVAQSWKDRVSFVGKRRQE